MNGQKWVGSGCVKWGRLSACEKVVDGNLGWRRDLQLLQFRLVVLLVMMLH